MISLWTYLAALALVGVPAPVPGPAMDTHPPVVVLTQGAYDSMSIVFRRFNRHWDELADLTTLERMLGTVRPTQLEYLGCLQGSVRGDTIWVESWQQAAKLKQLQLAVDGNCDDVPRLLGTWHTHPYRADLQNRAIKERSLSARDLETFASSAFPLTLVMWDADSMDAAVKDGAGFTHPVAVLIR